MKQTKIIIYILSLILIVLAIVIAVSLLTNDSETKKERYPTMIVIETSLGNIEVELFDKNSPISVANFKQYVDSNFYNGTVFHRVIKNFMIQGGGFTISGEDKQTNPPIVLEETNLTGLSNVKGTLAMARTMDPNSATSQFFINTQDNLFLDYKDLKNPGYAVFGKVVSGMDIVLKIEASSTTTKYDYYQDWPVEDVIIKRIYVKE
jgi:cyclophilin family peptidyl-prolyl cis-trans isomerase